MERQQPQVWLPDVHNNHVAVVFTVDAPELPVIWFACPRTIALSSAWQMEQCETELLQKLRSGRTPSFRGESVPPAGRDDRVWPVGHGLKGGPVQMLLPLGREHVRRGLKGIVCSAQILRRFQMVLRSWKASHHCPGARVSSPSAMSTASNLLDATRALEKDEHLTSLLGAEPWLRLLGF